jgi:uncharacterized protein YqgV (UPF0045/DUF77 family)
MPNASIAFQVMSKAANHTKCIEIIDKVIAIVKESGVSYEVGPMETTMEGELDTLIEIVQRSQYVCIEAGAESVFTNVKILYNPKGVMTIEEKVTKHR